MVYFGYVCDDCNNNNYLAQLSLNCLFCLYGYNCGRMHIRGTNSFVVQKSLRFGLMWVVVRVRQQMRNQLRQHLLILLVGAQSRGHTHHGPVLA